MFSLNKTRVKSICILISFVYACITFNSPIWAKDEIAHFQKLIGEFDTSLETTKLQLSRIQQMDITRRQYLEPIVVYPEVSSDEARHAAIGINENFEQTTPEKEMVLLSQAGTFYPDSIPDPEIAPEVSGLKEERVVPEGHEMEWGKPYIGIWELKNNLGTLGAFVEIGLGRYLPAKVAYERVNLTNMKAKQAYRALFPTASLKWEELEGETTTGPYEGRAYGIEVQQPIFNGGKLWYTLEQSKVDFKIAVKNYEKILSDLTFEIAKAYYGLAKAEKELENQKVLMDEGKRVLEIAKKAHTQGVIPKADYINVESMYNQIYFQFISAQKDLNLARFSLMQVLNVSPDEMFQCPDVSFSSKPIKRFNVLSSKEVKGEISKTDEFSELDMEGYLELAFKNRPEFVINELLVKFNEFGKKIGQSDAKPKVDLLGSLGKGGEVFEAEPLKLGDEWFLGLQVSVPWGGNTIDYSYQKTRTTPVIGESQRTQNTSNSISLSLLNNMEVFAKKKEAEINLTQAVYEFDEIKKVVSKEVKEAYLLCQKAVLQLDAAEAKVEYREKAYEILKIRAGEGEISVADLLEGFLRLSEERTAYNNALLNYYTSVITLNKAVGVWDM